MGNNLHLTRMTLRHPHRIVRTKHQLFKMFLNISVLSAVLVAIPFDGHQANAIETVKASALQPEETRSGSSLSYTQKKPPHATRTSKNDPCLSLLSFQKGSKITGRFTAPSHFSGRTDKRSPVNGYVDKTAAPAALSFLLGVRIALGPKDIVKNGERVQLASEFLATNKGGDNHALAVAAYRSCKNEYALTRR